MPYEPLVTLVNTPPSQNVNTSGDPNISGQGFTDSVSIIKKLTFKFLIYDFQLLES